MIPESWGKWPHGEILTCLSKPASKIFVLTFTKKDNDFFEYKNVSQEVEPTFLVAISFRISFAFSDLLPCF